MIEAIKHIRSVGRFKEDASSDLEFKKLTLIYGENAKGKSTLAAVFRSLATGDPEPIVERSRLGAEEEPHVVVECSGSAVFQDGSWNRSASSVTVYDDQFVEDNVHSGLQVDSEHRKNLHSWIIGSNAVALDRRVRELAQDVDEHNRQLGQIESQIGPGVLQGMEIAKFCDLAEDPDIDVKIDGVRGKIRALDQAEAIANAQLLEPLRIESLPLDPLVEMLAGSLPEIEQTALRRVRDHFMTLGPGGEQWVAQQAASVGSDPDGGPTNCPYCGQSLVGVELVEHYQAYFGEAYRSFVAAIEESVRAHSERNRSQVVTAFGEAVQTVQQRRTFWADFDPSLPSIGVDYAAISGCWAQLDVAMVQQLQDKQRRPLEQIELSEDVKRESAELRRRMAILEGVNGDIADINAKAEVLKSLAQDQNRQSLSDEMTNLERVKARHTAEISKHCRRYLERVALKQATEGERTDARGQLDQERKRAFHEFPATLNRYLEEFNAGFQIDQLRPTNTSSGTSSDYVLVIEELPVPLIAKGRVGVDQAPQQFRNTLSAGDRRTLASAVYFAGVDRAANSGAVVSVIDDPASSLDEHRTKATAQAIGSLVRRVDQVVVLSHNKRFLASVAGSAKNVDTSCLQIKDYMGASLISAWDMDADLQEDHVKRHRRLSAFVDGADDDLVDVAREIRPHLEHFLRITLPGEFGSTQMLGSFIRTCRKSVAAAEVMSGERLDELEKLNDFSKSFHHSERPEHRDELVGFVRRTLLFAKPEFDRL